MNATDRPIPAAAATAAGALAERFAADQALALRQNDALDRLHAANDRLWSGLHPDALALVYDELPDAGARSEVLDAHEPLRAVQEAHWAIHRAMCDYQTACEDRRHLAAEIGELAERMTTALTAAGWTREQAQQADVNAIAGAGR